MYAPHMYLFVNAYPKGALDEDVNRRIEIPQRTHIFKAKHCL